MTPPKEQKILPAVAAVIFNERGEVLLQQRKDVKRWCVISGHVEFGETVEEAILREIREEINVTAEVVRLIGVYSAPKFSTYHYEDKSIQYVINYFEVRLLEPLNLEISNGETLALKYFSRHNLPENLDLMNPNWLEDALNKSVTPYIR
jgi:8-oxo-dGTP pyrophosphatase MutT (NUDIX family)